MGFWTPPGASWAPGRPVEGALGGKGGVGKLYGGLLGPSWGSLGASWARFGSIFFPRGEGPGGHFEVFLGISRPRGKNCAFLKYLNVCLALLQCYMLSFVAFLAAWPAAPRKNKNMNFHWFLWVASQMCLFLAAPEASKFQRARVAKIDGNQAQTKNPRDQKQNNKNNYF